MGNDLFPRFPISPYYSATHDNGVRGSRGDPMRASRLVATTVTSIATATMVAIASTGSAVALAPEGAKTWVLQASTEVTSAKINPDVMYDIAQVAKARGVSPASLVGKLAWQNQWASAVTAIQEGQPEAFSSAGIDDSGNPWIAFKGSAPSDLRVALSAVPSDVEVREQTGWTEKQLTAAGQAAHYAVLKESKGHVHTDIDIVAGTVEVSVDGDSSASDLLSLPEVAAARASLPEATRFRINRVTALQGTNDRLYGGGYLNDPSAGTYCTAGFSVRSSASANGLMTAGHCTNGMRYEGRAVLNYISVLPVARGDVQWHNSSETADPTFYYAPSSLRALYSTANASPGMSLCKFGQSTDNTCDTVYKTAQCRDSYCNLIMMNRRYASGGDSGGPWYWGNTGYGIHSGGKQYLAIWRDMFTPVRSAASDLGLTVKLT